MNFDTFATILIITIAYFIIIDRRLLRLEKDIALLKNSIRILDKAIEELKENDEDN